MARPPSCSRTTAVSSVELPAARASNYPTRLVLPAGPSPPTQSPNQSPSLQTSRPFCKPVAQLANQSPSLQTSRTSRPFCKPVAQFARLLRSSSPRSSRRSRRSGLSVAWCTAALGTLRARAGSSGSTGPASRSSARGWSRTTARTGQSAASSCAGRSTPPHPGPSGTPPTCWPSASVRVSASQACRWRLSCWRRWPPRYRPCPSSHAHAHAHAPLLQPPS